jgi:hypothetical protein
MAVCIILEFPILIIIIIIIIIVIVIIIIMDGPNPTTTVDATASTGIRTDIIISTTTNSIHVVRRI